jgi:RNA polymerase sigma-70 factor (ECF subfamily)
MMRITELPGDDGLVGLCVEGRLTAESLKTLESAARTARARRSTLVLDLSAVPYADQAGAGLLRRLLAQGALLNRCSPFLSELLGEKGDGAAAGDEAELIEALRHGDPDAGEKMIRLHAPRMLATARRMLGNEDDAQDVVQEAFLSAFNGIRQFAGQARLSTWLHRIVVNATLMRMRSRRRRPEQSIEDVLPAFLEDGHFEESPRRWNAVPEEIVAAEGVRAAVRACIDRLPESYRAVLVLRDIEDMDTEEAASVLHTTPNAVKVRLHRARQALRALLEQEMPELAEASV